MKGKMKPAFAKKGYMDGGYAGKSAMQDAAAARGAGRNRGMVMKMADGGMACGHAGSLSGKNMKKGGK
jgi:hypothetical protein